MSRLSSVYPLRINDAEINLLSFAGYAALAAFSFYLCRNLYRTCLWYPYLSANSQLPGPKRSSLIRGNIPEILKADPGIEHEKWISEHGRVVRYSLFLGSEKLMLTDPAAQTHILVNRSYAYPKPSEVRGDLARILGKGILFSEGDMHRKQKRLLSPAFNGPNTNALLPIFQEKAETLRRKLTELVEGESGTWIGDVSAWIGRCTLDVIGAAGLGQEFNALEDGNHPLASAFSSLFGEPMSRGALAQIFFFLLLTFPILRNLPTKRARQADTSMRTMRTESEKILREAKAAAKTGDRSSGKDLLSLLVKANLSGDGEKNRMSDEEVMGQATTFMLAGYETTSTALIWCLHELARHQDTQRRLRDEIRQAKSQAGLDASDRLSVEQLSALSYLDAVTKEVLRLRAPVPGTQREAAEDDIIPLSAPITLKNGQQISSLPVKKGTGLYIPLNSVNLLTSIWGEDAKTWRPERFLENLPESVAAATSGFTLYSHLFTFLGGPRGCIGWKFAILEFKAILSTLIEVLHFEERDDRPEIVPKAFLVQRPYLKQNDGKKHDRASLPLKVTIAE